MTTKTRYLYPRQILRMGEHWGVVALDMETGRLAFGSDDEEDTERLRDFIYQVRSQLINASAPIDLFIKMMPGFIHNYYTQARPLRSNSRLLKTIKPIAEDDDDDESSETTPDDESLELSDDERGMV